MNTTTTSSLLATLTLLSACATPLADPQAADADGVSPPVAASRSAETILLVSLEDGSVIRQSIDVDAEICFKQNSASETTCFSRGEAIIDPLTQAVIGHEMIEDRIELIARSD